MKILVINGPNINMLGIREPAIYGKQSYKDLIKFIKDCAKKRGIKVKLFQSNSESAIVTKIQKAFNRFDGIVITTAAYTHKSVVLSDALTAVAIPAVEVHISKVPEREAFRQVSYAGMFCFKTITGLGFKGYEEAMDILIEKLK